MGQRVIQSSFTFGELDPRLFARADFAGYYKGAAKARNVVAVPQGALTKRFGTQIIAKIRDVTADADITNPDEVRIFAMHRASAGSYFIVFRKDNTTDTAFSVYDENFTLQATVAGAGIWTIAQLAQVRFTGSRDRLLIWHPEIRPYQLLNSDASDPTDWVLSAIDFAFKPTFDFSYVDGTSYADKFFLPIYTGSQLVAIQSLDLGGTPVAGVFHSNHAGGLFIGGDGSISRIQGIDTGYTTPLGAQVNAYEIEPFPAGAGTSVRGAISILTEPAWNDANATAPAAVSRGWPSLGKVVQGRLVAANTPNLPNQCWLSVINQYTDYDDSKPDADNAFSIGIDTDDEITALGDKNALIITAKRGTYSSGQISNEPLTPANATVFKEDSRGGKDIDTKVQDDLVFFADTQGFQVNAMASELTGVGSTNFDIYNASILSTQLINDPISIAQYTSTTDKGRYLLVVNADGTMAVLTSERKQEVSAWTLAETRGSYNEITDLNDTTVGIVKRSINSGATIAGNPEYVYKANSALDVWVNITDESADAASDVAMFETEGDYLFIGDDSPFDAIAVALNTVASSTITPTFEYFDKDDVWSTVSVTDGTSGFTVAGNITWDGETDTADWIPTEVNGIKNKFWIRIQRTAVTLTTAPIEDTIKINTQDVLLMEKFTFQATMDATITTTSNGSGLVTGLDNLIGQSVFVNADGSVEGPYIVNASGEITILELNASNVEVGIFFSPLVVPMPTVVMDQTNPNGADIYKPRLIKTFFVDYFESLGIYINNVPTADILLGSYVIGETIQPQTAVHEIKPRTGWEPRVEIEIKQKAPLPFTLRGIGYIVEVS